MQTPQFDNEADKVRWGYEHWIWPVEQVKALIADQSNAATFFCGHSAKAEQFIGLFDCVFILEADTETLRARLTRRPHDEFGGRSIEREFVMRLNETREDLPKGAVSIETSEPITRIVDQILAKVALAFSGGLIGERPQAVQGLTLARMPFV